MARSRARSAVDRERARRARGGRVPDVDASASAAPAQDSRRGAARTCAWCGSAIEVKARGRIPTWCSPACRQRVWEQRRAAESGRSAVEVVERVVQAPGRPAAVARPPRRDEWPDLLRELAVQLDTGRIYPRDIPAINDALVEVEHAVSRRAVTHPRYRR